MALAYPVTLTPDDNGTVLVQFPDFPEAQTFGDDRVEALTHAAEALETVIDVYIRDRRHIPAPKEAAGAMPGVVLPPMVAIKVEIYRAMQAQRVTKTVLARHLAWHLPQVDRLLDVRHQSRVDQLTAAASALGKRVSLTLQDVAGAAAIGRVWRTGRTGAAKAKRKGGKR